MSKKPNIVLKKDLLENYETFDAKYFAQKYNVCEYYIRSLASKLGVTSTKRWDLYKDEIIEKYENGATLKELAVIYGHDRSNIKKFLEKNNIKIRNSSECKQSYSFDINFFQTIDTEEKAYWLGFIYADGNIYKNKKKYKNVLQIGLAKIDKSHLEKFKISLKSEHPLYKDKESWKIMINNIALIETLDKLGVQPKKSLELIFPTTDQVPEHLIRHFIRGYFDGDGSISFSESKNTWSLSIVGTGAFLEAISNRFEAYKIEKTKISLEKRTGNGKIFYLTYGGLVRFNINHTKSKMNGSKLFDYLYTDSNIYLDRKYLKFKQLIQCLEQNS